ncbi:uncharacterized protein [Nicotiana tomentosiformis]|uniref:uncharacterized protein n=1 Tax=Nicotiana tomentosiformis TaxID=4098 RepID=UPI00388C956E
METKVKRAKAQQAALNLYNDWSFTTNLIQHPGGRIWVLWKPSVYGVSIIKVTDQLIHCEVLHMGTGRKFWVTIVFAYNDMALRRPLWQDIKEVYDKINGLWAVMGDFNCDLKSSRAFYTWNNKQEEQHREEGNKKQNRVFIYFNIWSQAPDFRERVVNGWKTKRRGTKMYELVGKLDNLKSALRKLNKEKFCKVERKAEDAMKELKACQKKIQQDPRNKELLKMERLISEDYNN